MTVRERIKTRMEETGVTVDKLAFDIGVSRSTVFRWLNGKTKKIDATYIAKIAESLNTTWSYLVGDENENALPGSGESGKEAAMIVDSLSPEKQQEGLRYLRYLSRSE